MATSKKDRAARLITLAEHVITDGGAGPVMNDPRIGQMAFSGISARVDAQIRKREVTEGPWADLMPDAARSLADASAGVAVLFACHPDGHVRQVAVEAANRWLASPGAAQIVALRTIDPVPPIHELAQASIGALLGEQALAREGSADAGVLPTNAAAAARQITTMTKCLDRCPDIAITALNLVPAHYTNGYPGKSDREVHRREQTLRHLLTLDLTLGGPDDPVRAEAIERMIDWYRAPLAADRAGEHGID